VETSRRAGNRNSQAHSLVQTTIWVGVPRKGSLCNKKNRHPQDAHSRPISQVWLERRPEDGAEQKFMPNQGSTSTKTEKAF
jgi:hypothetical protein